MLVRTHFCAHSSSTTCLLPFVLHATQGGAYWHEMVNCVTVLHHSHHSFDIYPLIHVTTPIRLDMRPCHSFSLHLHQHMQLPSHQIFEKFIIPRVSKGEILPHF